MTITDYLKCPNDHPSAALRLGQTKRELDETFRTLQYAITLKWFYLHEKSYVAHLKIPSGNHKQVFYDVLIEFNSQSLSKYDNDLTKASVRIFSNCPSFTYTYAKIYHNRMEFIDWARSKYPKEVLRKDPVQRNPDQILNYERSIYFAFRYINSNGRKYSHSLERTARKTDDPKDILSSVQDHERVIHLLKKRALEERIERRKKEGKTTDRYGIPTGIREANQKSSSRTTNKVKVIKKVKRTKKTKKVKKT